MNIILYCISFSRLSVLQTNASVLCLDAKRIEMIFLPNWNAIIEQIKMNFDDLNAGRNEFNPFIETNLPRT